VHPATTVAGATCTLGSTCTIASTALSDYGSASASGLFGSAGATTTVNGQACALASTCGIPFQHNGSGNTSIAGINFINSTVNANGVILTVSNPATNQIKIEATGTPTAAGGVTGFTFPTPAGSARIPQVIALGSTALNTGTVAPGACETTVTATATGALATDNLQVDFREWDADDFQMDIGGAGQFPGLQ